MKMLGEQIPPTISQATKWRFVIRSRDRLRVNMPIDWHGRNLCYECRILRYGGHCRPSSLTNGTATSNLLGSLAIPPCSRSELTMLRIISLAFAMILLIAGRVAAQQFSPTISVNGASGGTTVTATASMSVAVTNGPGNATDWIGVCNAGVPTSPTQCDYAGYSWDYLNCTQTTPATGVTSATCSLSAPNVAGNYYVGFFSNNTYNVLASAPFGVTVPSPSSPSITVNGSSSGTTVSAGASMSVRVANGPGNRADWIGVCNAGVPTSPTQCDYAGYSWDYLNCTQTYPSTGSTSGSCSLAAPGRGGNYIVGFFSNDTYTVLASAPFTISGGGGGSGGPNVVQS